MTIAAVSDTHSREVPVPDADVLVHAGDLCRYGSTAELRKAIAWLGSLPHARKIAVAGNHDGSAQRDPTRARALFEAAGVDYLETSGVVIAGVAFWGSPWTPYFRGGAFQEAQGRTLGERWAAMPERIDVLVTHGPAHGILDRTWRGAHVGDPALTARLAAVRPRLHLFGHIHEDAGLVRLGATLHANVATGEAGRLFALEPDAAAVEIASPLVESAAAVGVDTARAARTG